MHIKPRLLGKILLLKNKKHRYYMRNNLNKIELALLLILLTCFSARAEYDFIANGLYYRVISLENHTCACVDERNTKNMVYRSEYSGDIVIPSTVTFGERVFSVVEVGENAFVWSKITSVRIGGGVKVIRSRAFAGCEELQKVVLEDGITIIGFEAFRNCRNLKYVKLSNTLQEIGDSAFKDCDALSCEIVIPPTCKFLGGEALPYVGNYSVRIAEGSSPLTIYAFGLGHLGGETLYIGRNLSSKSHYVGVYEYLDVIIGDCVTIMPECHSAANHDVKIRTLIIGKCITTVPKIEKSDIETIRVRSISPPKAMGFLEKVYLNAVLYVPKGSLSEYQKADVWKDFWTIKEVEMR